MIKCRWCAYDASDLPIERAEYCVKQIAGSTPTVRYVKKGELMAARVGSILSELEAEGLGKVADLIVKPVR